MTFYRELTLSNILSVSLSDSSGTQPPLNLSRGEGEKWIVNLIRETRIGADAKLIWKK